MAVISVAALVCIVVGCVTILLVPMKGAESSFRKQSITPHLFAHSILSVVIFIAWIFGLVGTDSNILGAPSTATQYIFGFMLIIHAIVLLILTLLRTEAIRKMWLNLLNRITGRSGKYDFAADDTPRSKGTSKDAEVIGLGQSGQFSREGSIKKKDLNAEDVTPLSVSKVILDMRWWIMLRLGQVEVAPACPCLISCVYTRIIIMNAIKC